MNVIRFILVFLFVAGAMACVQNAQKESKPMILSAEDYVKEAKRYYQRDDMQKAMESVEKAIELNPKLPSIYILRAKIREELGDPDFEDDYNYSIELEEESRK